MPAMPACATLLVFATCAVGLSAAEEAGPGAGYRVFHIGNSFTVNTHFHAEYFAKKAGWAGHDHLCAWAPGMPIGGGWGHWQRPDSSAKSQGGDHLCGWQKGLKESAWDRIIIQPFFEDQQGCITASNGIIDYAIASKSPGLQAIVKQIWFMRDDASFEAGRQPNGVAYTEGIADGIAKAHPGMVVRICPSGLVIQELRRLTALGQVPGVAHEAEWYADPIHLSKLGNFADGMTQFITLYRVNPVVYNLPPDLSPKQWYGYTVNPQTAAKIMEVAWSVTGAYPRSGVTARTADATPPSAPAGLSAAQVTSADVRLQWTAATDAESGIATYAIYQDGVKLPGVITATQATIASLAPATTYAFTVAAYNRAGLPSTQSATVTAVTGTPAVPVTGLTLKPATLSLNIAVAGQLSAGVVPAKADNPGVRWSSSDPAVAVVDGEGCVTGKAAGSVTITATAYDGTRGVQSATAAVTVLPNRPPTASFVVAPAKKDPLAVTCDGAASADPDPKDGIFGWDWDFGDGTPHFYGANPGHAYARAGTYTVTLVVMDNNGTTSAAATRPVVVPAR